MSHALHHVYHYYRCSLLPVRPLSTYNFCSFAPDPRQGDAASTDMLTARPALVVDVSWYGLTVDIVALRDLLPPGKSCFVQSFLCFFVCLLFFTLLPTYCLALLPLAHHFGYRLSNNERVSIGSHGVRRGYYRR
jgi:hypothetical protein